MEGRETGSEGYRKAARYVTAQFEKNGLKPAGEHGYYQTVPLHSVRLNTRESKIELVRPSGVTQLQWLRQVTTAPREGKLDAPLVFAGDNGSGADLDGKIAVAMIAAGGSRPWPPNRALAGIFAIDRAYGLEPMRWPWPYVDLMTIRHPGTAPPGGPAGGLTGFFFNHADADMLFSGTGHTYRELVALQDSGKPLPRFPLNATLRATMKVDSADLESDNILAVLPGSDATLAEEYVVVSAHLDGYGYGEPWNGDSIYNGVFDDEAYVAELIDFAERLKESGTKLKRSLLFCVTTGEEKGLLGSKYFTAHPTVAIEKLVADINLDDLRPLFPLKTLTMLALDDSTLGDTAKKVAAPMGIHIQGDPEPERNELHRGDQFNFLEVGVPSTAFLFGFGKGSREEATFRRWYAERYHSPADDLQQPWDPVAAAKLNDFLYNLVTEVANAAERPKWNPGSPFAKK